MKIGNCTSPARHLVSKMYHWNLNSISKHVHVRMLYTGLSTHVVGVVYKIFSLVHIASVRRVSYAQRGDAQFTIAHLGTSNSSRTK